MNQDEDSETITLNDFSNICRTCLGSEKLYPIQHTIIGGCRAIELVEVGVMINVFAHALLPQKICEECLRELHRLNEFKQQCQTNEEALLLLIANCNLQEVNYEAEAFPNVSAEYKDEITAEETQVRNVYNINETKVNNVYNITESKVKNVYNIKETKVENDQEVQECKVTLNKCYRCNFIGSNREELKKHQLDSNHIPGKIHECPFCNKFFDKTNFNEHMRSHTNERPFECDICYKTFTLEGNLKRHKMIHTGERPHTCTFCGKGFIQRTSLTAHLKIHEPKDISSNIIYGDGEEAYQCEECGRIFKMQHFYKAHMRSRHNWEMDEEPRNFICDICSKAFKTRTVLNTHRATHDERKYLCNFCGKATTTRTILQAHLRTHTGERPHMCTVCGKSFGQYASYRLHKLIHQGLRPYSCPHCQKRFIQPTHLKYHLRTHSGERPFSCSYCGKTFALKGNLTVHVRMHTGETPYRCPICDKGFYDSSSRNKHHNKHFMKEKVEILSNLLI